MIGRTQPRGPSAWAGFAGAALLFGAVAGWGRPGIEASLAFLVGVTGLCWLGLRARTRRAALAAGALFGVVPWSVGLIGSLSWTAIVPSTFVTVGMVLHAIPIALWARGVGRRMRALPLALATTGAWALWLELGETVLGLPFNPEALAVVAAHPFLLGAARVVGGKVVAGVIVATCLECARQLHGLGDHGRRATVGALVGAATAAVTGLALLSGSAFLIGRVTPQTTANVSVGIPQLALDHNYFKRRLSTSGLTDAANHELLSQLGRLSASQLVIMTEAHDGRFGLAFPRVREYWGEVAANNEQAIVVTSYLPEPEGRKSNAAVAFGPDGSLVGVHRKVELAPFGERFLAAGEDFTPVAVAPGVRLGILICHEAYTTRGTRELVEAGANVLTASTSDVTFGSSATVFEHLAMSQVRAIEAGRSIVWASNAGPSGVIDRWGRFRGGPFREAVAVQGIAPLHEDHTPFMRYRWAWSLLAALSLLAGVALARRSAAPPVPPPAPLATWPVTRRLGNFVLGAFGLAAAASTVILSPAMVEYRHGDSRRARASIAELWLGLPLKPDGEGLERYRAEGDDTAAGAIAYFLAYHGIDATTATLEGEPPHDPTWKAIQDYLQRQYGLTTQLTTIDAATHPNAAMLVRTRTGEVGVLDTTVGTAPVLFLPSAGRVGGLAPDLIPAMLEPHALFPAVRIPDPGSPADP